VLPLAAVVLKFLNFSREKLEASVLDCLTLDKEFSDDVCTTLKSLDELGIASAQF
jgi:hypothetical protein